MSRIGVLALQGGFALHVSALERLGHQVEPVRYARQLDQMDGFVFPGGESSTMLKLIHQFELWKPIDNFVTSGKPVLATCAGFILAAREVVNPRQESFGWLDVSLRRNAWGRQLDSFEALADDGHTPLTFIRAPRVIRMGEGVDVVHTYKDEPVMVRSGNLFGATFHPELTGDDGIHRSVFG